MHRVHHSIETGEMNKNFGFNFPWWDRILGTYKDQPAAGHHATTNGLHEHQADANQSLFWMIVLPFRRRRGPVQGALPTDRSDCAVTSWHWVRGFSRL